MADVAQGAPLDAALRRWSTVDLGTYSRDGRTFFPGGCPSRPAPLDWQSLDHYVIPGGGDKQAVTVYHEAGVIRAIAAERRLRLSRFTTFTSTDRARGGLQTLPDFIALPRDSAGRPILPRSPVTALVEAQQAWHSEFGEID